MDQKVATSASCRDIKYKEKRSRQDQAVATSAPPKTCRNQTRGSATRIETTEVATRTRCRDRLTNWASNLKSTTKCIEIRAQLQNHINIQLLLKKRSSWRLEREIWVAEGSCILIFLFFYFLFLFLSFLD